MWTRVVGVAMDIRKLTPFQPWMFQEVADFVRPSRHRYARGSTHSSRRTVKTRRSGFHALLRFSIKALNI
uniref:Uncharacterized protein n=1 Tax=Tetraselmis sp. GSL018 TaxID=582737 RepID=A0A061RZY9_9CHLO